MSETCPMCREYRLYHGDTCPEHQSFAPPATREEDERLPTIEEVSGCLSDAQCRAIMAARDAQPTAEEADIPIARPNCTDCEYLRQFDNAPEWFNCHVVNIRLGRAFAERFCCNQFEAKCPPTPPDAALIAEIDRWLMRGFHVTDVEVAGTLRKLRDRIARQTAPKE